MNYMLRFLRLYTVGVRHRLAAELHHYLTMPEYYYPVDGDVIIPGDEIRVSNEDCWSAVQGSVGLHSVRPMIRRRKP